MKDFDSYSLDDIDIAHHTLLVYRRALAEMRDAK